MENAREGGGHVQRAIKARRLDEIEDSDLLDGLIAAVVRHSRRSIVLSSFYGARVNLQKSGGWAIGSAQ